MTGLAAHLVEEVEAHRPINGWGYCTCGWVMPGPSLLARWEGEFARHRGERLAARVAEWIEGPGAAFVLQVLLDEVVEPRVATGASVASGVQMVLARAARA